MAITKYITLDSLQLFYEQLRKSRFKATDKLFGTLKLYDEASDRKILANQRELKLNDFGEAYIDLFQGDTNIGTATQPIYIQNGTFLASEKTVGSAIKPIYMNKGTFTAGTANIGSSTAPIYMLAGELTMGTANIGSNTTPIYMDKGELKAIKTTMGGKSQPIYLKNGEFALCDDMGTVLDEIKEVLDVTTIKKISLQSSDKRLKVDAVDNADGSAGKSFIVNLTELITPTAPTIDTTSYSATAGSNVSVTVTRKTTNSSMYYKIKNGSTWPTSWTSVSSTQSFTLSPGFKNNENSTQKTYYVKLKSSLNGVDSSERDVTINIKHKISQPEISISPASNSYGTSATITIKKSDTKPIGSDGVSKVKTYYTTNGTTPSSSSTELTEDSTSITVSTTKNKPVLISANTYQVIATSTDTNNYSNSSIAKTPANNIYIGQRYMYYGMSTKATLDNESDILALASSGGGAEVAEQTLTKNKTYTITEPESLNGKTIYLWLCTGGTVAVGNVYSSADASFNMGFNDAIQRDGWNCYRVGAAATGETGNKRQFLLR